MNKDIKFLTIFIAILTAIVTIIGLKINKDIRDLQPVVNYNIEHVDTVIIQETQQPVLPEPVPEVKDIVEEVPNYYLIGYPVDEFRYIPIKINNWTVSENIQKILYNKCKKYNINYIQTLAIMYKEGARNNQYAMHINSNGTIDIGLMQVNSSNIDILQKIAKTTDLEKLKDISTNIECACYLIYRNENYLEDVKTLYDSLVVYNGGLKTLLKINSNEYTESCDASLYASKVMSYMDKLYESYLEVE